VQASAAPAGRPELRLLEPLGALSLVTDLGRGRAVDHALRCSLVAVAISERLELAPAEASRAFYVSLLRSIGCTASSHEYAVALGGDDIAVRREGDLADPTVPREALRLVVRLAAGRPLSKRPLATQRSARRSTRGSSAGTRAAARAAWPERPSRPRREWRPCRRRW
jgi:hypothetical protein